MKNGRAPPLVLLISAPKWNASAPNLDVPDLFGQQAACAHPTDPDARKPSAIWICARFRKIATARYNRAHFNHRALLVKDPIYYFVVPKKRRGAIFSILVIDLTPRWYLFAQTSASYSQKFYLKKF